MDEGQVVKLLEEIRDLQKQHIDKYGEAVRNQEASIEMQKRGVRRQGAALILLGIFLFALFLFWAWVSKQ